MFSIAQTLPGAPERLDRTGSQFPSGVDAEATLLLDHGEGRSATLINSLGQASVQVRVFGTAGSVDVLPLFHPQTIVFQGDTAEPPFGMTPAQVEGAARR